MKLRLFSLIPLLLLGIACSRERSSSGEEEQMAMHSMPSVEMLPAFRSYLDSLLVASPAELVTRVGEHASRVQQMLDAMNRDMNAMNMQPDTAWAALADSVRNDLSVLGPLQGEQLILGMRAHVGRLRRLLDRHESMMLM